MILLHGAMRTAAYILLASALVSLAFMMLFFFLAIFGAGERTWSSWALPAGMATLFLFGIGAALSREATSREELDRAIVLLTRDVRHALSMETNRPHDRLDHVLPALSRFRRAADAASKHKKLTRLIDLVDLVDYEQQHDENRAEQLLNELDLALSAIRQSRGRARGGRSNKQTTSNARSRR